MIDESLIGKLNISIREKIKKISIAAETEIEPQISSEIIDGVVLNGLLFGICPGGIYNKY